METKHTPVSWDFPESTLRTCLTAGGTHFRVWAPRRRSVAVQVGNAVHPLAPEGHGYFAAEVPGVTPGDRYRFLLDGHLARPDPSSRFQPEGVHGPSEVVDPGAFSWTDTTWRGVAKRDLVVYELHVGAFTAAGTYRAALERLDHVLALGATAVELLPLAQTPGRWNWGYDGVDLYAPNHNYGSPEDLRCFVDTCHARGLAVLLDVVYNHLGPEGSYWADFGPYFSEQHRTPWGPALNFDSPDSAPVRSWIVQNALYWLEEFHFDGLRLDAIHLMRDDSQRHIIAEIAAAVDGIRQTRPYPVHLIAEANVHDPWLLASPPAGAGYDLLWNDEIPHALFSASLGQHHVHHRVYQGARDLRRALDAGFVFAWDAGARAIQRHEAPDRTDLSSMLQGLQTHDQIGNHPLGHRLHQVASPEFQRTAAALTLLYPAVPLCFMGEEFAAPSPFCFFVDFGDPRLRRAVVEGRKRDYAHHDWASFASPLDEETFRRSKLAGVAEGDAGMLAWYRALIQLRAQWLRAGVLDAGHLSVRHDEASDFFLISYGSAAQVAANFGASPVALPATAEVQLHSAWAEFGGCGLFPGNSPSLPPLSAAIFRDNA